MPGPHWCLVRLVAAYDDYARLASALRENRVLCRQQTDIRPVVGNVWRLAKSSNSPAFASCGGHHQCPVILATVSCCSCLQSM